MLTLTYVVKVGFGIVLLKVLTFVDVDFCIQTMDHLNHYDKMFPEAIYIPVHINWMLTCCFSSIFMEKVAFRPSNSILYGFFFRKVWKYFRSICLDESVVICRKQFSSPQLIHRPSIDSSESRLLEQRKLNFLFVF